MVAASGQLYSQRDDPVDVACYVFLIPLACPTSTRSSANAPAFADNEETLESVTCWVASTVVCHYPCLITSNVQQMHMRRFCLLCLLHPLQQPQSAACLCLPIFPHALQVLCRAS